MSISGEFFERAMQNPAIAIELEKVHSAFEKDKLNDQSIKADAGKINLTLVPLKIIWEIGKVRMFGSKKYTDPESWRRVDPERYKAAAFRHFLAFLADPYSVDEESGLPHLSHLACNIAFLIEIYFEKAKAA